LHIARAFAVAGVAGGTYGSLVYTGGRRVGGHGSLKNPMVGIIGVAMLSG
jgi:hypothetical protein